MNEPRLLHGRVFIQLTMSFELTSFNSPSAEARRQPTINGNFISVGEVLKIVPYFKGIKTRSTGIHWYWYTVFAVINPVQEDVLYKFVLMRINWEPRYVTGT